MIKKKIPMKLRLVDKSDYKFLYDLLKERNPVINISHKNMPIYSQHVKFVSSMPYYKWYVVEYDGEKIGSIYLSKDNEVGLHVKNNTSKNSFFHQKILDMLMTKHSRKKYIVNVNPKNKTYINFLKKNGFTKRQITYAKDIVK